MKVLAIGDIHIKENNISELSKIFKEIFSIKADVLIQMGDLFDKTKLTPNELNFACETITKAKNLYKEVYLMAGNDSHEFYKDSRVTNFFKYLSGKIKIVPDEYDMNINDKKYHFGHYMLHSSKLQYGTGRKGIKDFKNYNQVLLAHQHNPQELQKDRIWHIGSISYLHFNEATDPYKRIALIDDKVNFIKLKSPIPMKDVKSVEDLEHLPERTKVRLVISSFKQFKKEVNKINNYRSKFPVFKTKIDIKDKSTELQKATNSKNINEIVNEFIEKITDTEVKNELREQFREEL